ncbi:hypothetical protein [Haloferula sp. A504]|uniref:hypothetical protein n=1 Tax=Haloferula sp. A504 TaxID=3373601 RepID=UPI0031CAB5C4|nr:hypothetical protein [Verrucomicrobiaceae bacterium E54]
MLVSCGERKEVVADETRPLTMREESLNLEADNDERFQPGRPQPRVPVESPPSPVAAGVVPGDWKQAPPTGFRLLNYTFGTAGQVYVSASRGGVIDNVNRWLKQFGRDAIDAGGLEGLEKVETAGHRGVWVEAEGDFGGGMGQSPQSGWGLLGVVAENEGQILTVKMLGPGAEVAAQEENLRAFVEGLRTTN